MRCQIDNHAARLHGINHLTRDQRWCRFAWDQCGGHNDVHLFRLGGKQRHLGFDKGLGHHLGVAVAAARFLFEIQLKELCAHALDLLFYFRAGIKGAYDGT